MHNAELVEQLLLLIGIDGSIRQSVDDCRGAGGLVILILNFISPQVAAAPELKQFGGLNALDIDRLVCFILLLLCFIIVFAEGGLCGTMTAIF